MFQSLSLGLGTDMVYEKPHPEDHLHLRLHRARSVILTADELVEIRAAQRTFEGAYMRTALGQFSFSLIILKIFTSEFYAMGALFAVYGAAVMIVAIYRRHEGHRQFFTSPPAENEDGASGSPRLNDNDRRNASRGNPNENVLDGIGEGYDEPTAAKKFRTSGNSVALLAVLSLAAYTTLLVLTWQLVA